MKPACARWSAAMDQVRDQPPSGCVESDYVSTNIMLYLLVGSCFIYLLVMLGCDFHMLPMMICLRRNMPT